MNHAELEEQRRERRARSLHAQLESRHTAERKDPETSWNTTSYRRDILPGMPVPPDRSSHEAHVEKLKCYTQAVSREPGVLESAVLSKLGIESMELSDEGVKEKELLS
eukprot:s2639_g3.t1